MLNNVKSNYSFNEMNKRDLPAMDSTVFRSPLVILLGFFGFIAEPLLLPSEDDFIIELFFFLHFSFAVLIVWARATAGVCQV